MSDSDDFLQTRMALANQATDQNQVSTPFSGDNAFMQAVEALSLARSHSQILSILKRAARALNGADGATIVLRDKEHCHYVAEDAISALWEGQRFPLTSCISGWVMLNAEPAAILDIYSDPRIPADAYRPTFVKSLAMVPIRPSSPMGAIGNYWAQPHSPSEAEVRLLQQLANFASIAFENLRLYQELGAALDDVATRTQEIEAFAWAASHDLQSPLRAISHLAGRTTKALQECDLEAAAKQLRALDRRVHHMRELLVSMHTYAGSNFALGEHDELASGTDIKQDLLRHCHCPDEFEIDFAPEFHSIQLPRIAAQRVFANLINNSISHHDRADGSVSICLERTPWAYNFCVKDDGPGIPEPYRERVFELFQTLLPKGETATAGVGLAIVRKTLSHYGGAIHVCGRADGLRGSQFNLTWPINQPDLGGGPS